MVARQVLLTTRKVVARLCKFCTRVSDILDICFTRLMMNTKDARSKLAFVYLGYVSNVMLLVALGLGLHAEWVNSQSENMAVLVISMFGLLVFGISCALQYYFNQELFGQALLHIWLGCILGVIIFTDSQEYQYETMEESMNILLLASPAFGLFWAICERLMQLVKHEPKLFSFQETLESLGLILAALITGTIDSISLTLCVVAFILHLTAIRLKSLLSVGSLVAFLTIVSFMIIPRLQTKVNIYGLVCFAGRHAFIPIIDLYFSSLTTLERWQAFFTKSGFIRKIVLTIIFILNLTSAALIGQLSTTHKEWFVVVPLFGVFALLWLCFHVIYIITTWKLMNKVTECNLTYSSLSDNHRSMTRIMASKGIRHFGLISQRLIFMVLLTTILLMCVGWDTRTNISIGLVLVLIPIEAVTLSLFWELGDNLGGTCIGYALISPYTGSRANGSAKLLSTAAVQDIGTRATTSLNKIQQFFNRNMIDNFGSDFSSSGISDEYLKSKITQFFSRKTSDGPRYDTYLLYYSGDCLDSGDWALTDNGSLKLDTILEWWSEKNSDSGSRLIIICDTVHSWRWAQDVSKLEHYVALQTCKVVRMPDVEFGTMSTVGAFTDDWVSFNMDEELETAWSDKARNIRAVYKVSKTWTDFKFHLPTSEDIEEHWNSSFPKFTRPLIKCVNFLQTGSLCCCCDGFRDCVKRKRMQWLPPKVTDTGHGFKLVRS